MAKWQNDTMLLMALGWLYKATSSVTYASPVETVCATQPTTYGEATTLDANMLATVSLTTPTDFTEADGDTSGKKLTIAEKTGVSVTGTGTQTADHIALTAVVASSNTLLYVTTCTSQSVVNGNTITIPAWDIELRDPT